MTLEGKLTAAVIRRLKKMQRTEPIWWLKIHGGPMQRAGVPDLVVVRGGHAIFIELKSPDGRVGPLQASEMRKLAGAGATVGVVRSIEEFEEMMD